MELSKLTAVSPIDGRYRGKTQVLETFFSEYALMQYRVKVEVEYFIWLTRLPLKGLEDASLDVEALRDLYRQFSIQDAQRIKEIETVTNHDVKAVEYFIKERLDALGGMDHVKEFIHFGLTSQDVNNTSFPLMVKDALHEVIIPQIEGLIEKLTALAQEWKDVSMLARTHGQPASPTRLGKELMVFVYRLSQQLSCLKTLPLTAKFGGATGNFNAHHVAYPDVDWKRVGDDFVQSLGLVREEYTTQISNYDALAAVFDALRRICTVIVDLDRDIWLYISMNYFRQRIKAGEVGSSAMPHKVNPIDFENSEGNLLMASAVLEFLSRKLPISRLQRDLTDSTVIRNVGVPFAHIFIALQSTMTGLDKLILNETCLTQDLQNNWAVVAEAVQTILRREHYPNPYEALKALTRGNEDVTQETFAKFIHGLDISEEVKQELLSITPTNYVGI